MARLDLDAQERKILTDALESRVSELRMEISSTDQKDVRDMLKRREQALNSIRDKLRLEEAPDGEQAGGRH